MTDYRNNTAISQSDLSLVKCLLTGEEKNIPVRAYMLGKAIHEKVLEPELFNPDNYPVLLDNKASDTFKKCTDSLLSDAFFQKLLSGNEKEKTVFWKEEITGIDCKARIDLLTPNAVIDLKTTSEYTQEKFESRFAEYGYDLQAAFYMDAVGLERAIIIGVSKRNGKVFYTYLNSSLIAEGRKKYLFLLNKILKFDLFEKIYELRQQAREREERELQLLFAGTQVQA